MSKWQNGSTAAVRQMLEEFSRTATPEELVMIHEFYSGRLLGNQTSDEMMRAFGPLIAEELMIHHQRLKALGIDNRLIATARSVLELVRATPLERREMARVYRHVKRVLSDSLRLYETSFIRGSKAVAAELGPKHTAMLVLAQLVTTKNPRIVMHGGGRCVFATTNQLAFLMNLGRESKLSDDQVGRLFAKHFDVGRTKIGGEFYRGVFVRIDSVNYRMLKRLHRAVSV